MTDMNLDLDLSNLLFLDQDFSSQLKYLGEGAANVVYRVNLPPRSPSVSSSLDIESDGGYPTTPPESEIPPLRMDPRLEGQLLRLRKSNPATLPIIECQKFFESVIRQLYADGTLVEQTLFRPSPGLIRDLNRRLRHMETYGLRPRKRHGVFLAEDEIYGMLVTDMTCAEDDDVTSVEFKPKWLAQSPSAPAGANRCRTCALRAMRLSKQAPAGVLRHIKSEFCPLSLISADQSRVAMAVDVILGLPESKRKDENTTRRRLIEFLLENSLLRRLRDFQMKLDPHGVLSAGVSGKKFLTAMTLRDCTLFLKVCLYHFLFEIQDCDHFLLFRDRIFSSLLNLSSP